MYKENEGPEEQILMFSIIIGFEKGQTRLLKFLKSKNKYDFVALVLKVQRRKLNICIKGKQKTPKNIFWEGMLLWSFQDTSL